jgi:hypothetical protein
MSDQPYRNDTDMKTKREMLTQDRDANTYFTQAQNNLGAELGGRFAHLARGQQEVVGQTPTMQYPRQPNYWANADSNVEMPLGVSVEDVPDMTTVDGVPKTFQRRI